MNPYRRRVFTLYVSQVVLDEAMQGDAEMVGTASVQKHEKLAGAGDIYLAEAVKSNRLNQKLITLKA